MARIPLVRLDGTDQARARGVTRLLMLGARRWMGQEADPLGAVAHHRGVLWPMLVFEGVDSRRRSVLPRGLADLVQFVTAVDIGCSWCVDYGASAWERRGLDPQVLREAVDWRASDRFDADQRAAFAYAGAITAQPQQVDDAMVADLRVRFGDAGVVELTFLVALENQRSRFNRAIGLSNQGFSSGEACALAAAAAGPAGRALG
jgi:AhpD family alkylhydroperoxidase